MRKTKKDIRMIWYVLVAAMLLIGASGFDSLAAETLSESMEDSTEIEVLEAKVKENSDYSGINLYTMLADCMITVRCDTGGMHIDISTGTVGKSSVSGVKDIKIWKKGLFGWSLVATSSGGEDYDCLTMGVTVLYSNAVKGATYKITCVHYGNVNGYTEGTNDSGSFVFTY